MDKASLQVIEIVEGTSVDGPGLRTAIYFSGCRHCCPGCQNPESWDFEVGRQISIDELLEVIKRNDFNVSFSGGDPLYQIVPLINLAKEIKNLGKTIWCYTGFTYEEILGDETLAPVLKYIDVLVDGPFIEKLKDPTLLFRGSSNQRLIDCRKSENAEQLILWDYNLLP